MLVFNRLIYRFSDQQVVGLSDRLQVKPGALLWLKGDNGVGKSTVLRLMAHVWRGETETLLEGQAVGFRDPAYCRLSDYLCPEDPLPGMLSIEDYLPLAASDAVLPWLGDRKRVIATLSYGMQMRLRWLPLFFPSKVRYFFVDEPFTALDTDAKAQLQQQWVKLCAQGVALVVASHESLPMADELIEVHAMSGRL